MADFEKTIKLLETAMNYNSVGLGRIVVHHDTLSDALELLKSQQAEIEQSEAEMMVEHKDGTVEYVKDIDNIMLLADKNYQIGYTGRF